MTLEKGANVATIIVCVMLGAHLGLRFWSDATSAAPPAPAPNVGDALRDSGAVSFGKAPGTLVLFTSSKCQHCTVSMPAFQKVVSESRTRGLRVIAATTEAPEVNRQYLKTHNVAVDETVSADAIGIRTRATPLLLLVNRAGKIRAVWLGEFNEARAGEVIAAIGRS